MFKFKMTVAMTLLVAFLMGLVTTAFSESKEVKLEAKVEVQQPVKAEGGFWSSVAASSKAMLQKLGNIIGSEDKVVEEEKPKVTAEDMLKEAKTTDSLFLSVAQELPGKNPEKAADEMLDNVEKNIVAQDPVAPSPEVKDDSLDVVEQIQKDAKLEKTFNNTPGALHEEIGKSEAVVKAVQ